MSSEARKQRQAERKKAEKAKNKQNKTNSNKKNKQEKIVLVDTPFGNIEVKNTVMYRVIQELFKAANKGQFEKDVFLSCERGKSPLKAQWKGIVATLKGKGNFSNQYKYNVSWQKASSVVKEIGFTKEAVNENTPVENIDMFLPQILYLTTLRAQKRMQSMQENKDSIDSKENESTINKPTEKVESTLKKGGSILIVEDIMEEKIGSFEDYIENQGYDIVLAEDLETARIELDRLLKDNIIDGLILDFLIPESKQDKTLNPNDPKGIVLLQEFLFKLNNRRIPVVINTTRDKDYKKEFLSGINLEMPLYDVDHEMNPLSRPSAQMIREIMEMFNTRNQTRKIKPDKKWNGKGETGFLDKNGQYHYRREGD